MPDNVFEDVGAEGIEALAEGVVQNAAQPAQEPQEAPQEPVEGVQAELEAQPEPTHAQEREITPERAKGYQAEAIKNRKRYKEQRAELRQVREALTESRAEVSALKKLVLEATAPGESAPQDQVLRHQQAVAEANQRDAELAAQQQEYSAQYDAQERFDRAKATMQALKPDYTVVMSRYGRIIDQDPQYQQVKQAILQLPVDEQPRALYEACDARRHEIDQAHYGGTEQSAPSVATGVSTLPMTRTTQPARQTKHTHTPEELAAYNKARRGVGKPAVSADEFEKVWREQRAARAARISRQGLNPDAFMN